MKSLIPLIIILSSIYAHNGYSAEDCQAVFDINYVTIKDAIPADIESLKSASGPFSEQPLSGRTLEPNNEANLEFNKNHLANLGFLHKNTKRFVVDEVLRALGEIAKTYPEINQLTSYIQDLNDEVVPGPGTIHLPESIEIVPGSRDNAGLITDTHTVVSIDQLFIIEVIHLIFTASMEIFDRNEKAANPDSELYGLLGSFWITYQASLTRLNKEPQKVTSLRNYWQI